MNWLRRVQENYCVEAVSYEDFFPPAFQEFVKKYRKDGRSLYVQFSNYAGDTLEKTAYQLPNHSDPAGIYGYPLPYVIKHPADIWYGRRAKYLRVLEFKAKKPLYLHNVSRDDAETMLRRLGIDSKVLDKVSKKFKNRFGTSRVNKDAKVFFQAIQMDMSGEEPKLRSAPEQTALFRKLGFDAIVESSRKNTGAVINSREPEQVIFLTRPSFDVVEVFQMRGEADQKLTATTPSERETRKFAQSIAAALGDQIAESDLTRFWTKKGRRIEIDYVLDAKYMENRKMGEKIHREFKDADKLKTRVEMATEHGSYRREFGTSVTFATIVSVIKEHLSDKPEIEGWIPETKKLFEQKKQAVRDEYHENQRRQTDEHKEKDYPEQKREWEELGEMLETPLTLPSDWQEGNVILRNLLGVVRALGVRLSQHAPVTSEDFDQVWAENADALGKDDVAMFRPLLKKLYTSAKQGHDMLSKAVHYSMSGNTQDYPQIFVSRLMHDAIKIFKPELADS